MEVFYIYQQSNQNLSDEKQQQNSVKHFLESKLNDEIEKKSFKESMKIDYSLNHANIDFEKNIYEVHAEIQKAKGQLSNLLKNQKAKTDEMLKSISQNYDNLNNYEDDIRDKENDIQKRYNSIMDIVSKRQQETKFTSAHNFSGINEQIYHSKQESLRNANSNLNLSLAPGRKIRNPLLVPDGEQVLGKSRSANAFKGRRRITGLESLPPK